MEVKNDLVGILLVSFDSDNGWGNIVSIIKEIRSAKPSPELVNFFSILDAEPTLLQDDLNSTLKKHSISNKYVSNFLDDFKKGNITLKEGQTYLQGYEDFLKSTGVTMDWASVKTTALSVSMKALSSIGWMALISGITLVITQGANAIDRHINHAKYAAEAMKEAQEAINQSQEDVKNAASVLSEYQERFLELSQGVDRFSNNLQLSNDSYAEYLSICNQLAEIFPQLVIGYDSQGNALLAIGSNAEETSAKLQNLMEGVEDSAQQTLIDNMNGVAEGVASEVKTAQDSINGMKANLANLQSDYNKHNVDLANSHGSILFNDNDFSTYGAELQKALSAAEIEYELRNGTNIFLKAASPEQMDYAQELYDNWMEEENAHYAASKNGILRDITEQEAIIQTSYSKMTANLQAWVKDNYDYQYLSDASARLVDAMIPAIKWDQLPTAPSSAEDYQRYIEDTFLTPLLKIPSEHKQEVDDLFQELLSFEDGDLSILPFAQQLSKKLDEMGIPINLTPIIADEQEAQSRLNQSISKLAESENGEFFTSSDIRVSKDDYELLQDYVSGFNADQIALWLDVTRGAKTAQEAIDAYEEALKTLPSGISFSDIFALETVDNTVTELGKISKSIDTIQNAYQTLSSAIKDYNENGFLSIDTLQSITELGSGYIDFLVDEEGNIRFDQQALKELTAARLQDMQAQVQQELMRQVSAIQTEADANLFAAQSYREKASAINEVTSAMLANKVNQLDISQEAKQTVLDAANKSLTQINTLFNHAITGVYANPDFAIGNSSSDASDASASASASPSSAADDTYKKLVDFFDRRKKILDDANSLLAANLDNVMGSYAKNTLVDSQLTIAEERFRNYTDALSMYAGKAHDALAKLPSNIAEQVRNGSVSMTDFIGNGNEEIVTAIEDYQNWADKVSDCRKELSELKETIRQLELDKFNHIISDFTDQFDIYQNSNDLIDKQISLFQEAGELIGESFYTTQIEQAQKQLSLLEQEKSDLIRQLGKAISSGRIQTGTDEWLEMVNALSDVDSSILDCKTSLEQFDNAILELHTELFERIQTQFSNLYSELENVIGLFDGEETTTADGSWTDSALSHLGLLSQQYELAQYQIKQYEQEINDLNTAYLAGKYSATEYADRLSELNTAQWEAVDSSESALDSMVQLNETRINEIIDGIQEEIDAYQELITSQINALDAEKELHDYEKSISEKTKSVADLERQIAAMENDTSAATIAKRLQLEDELANARQELEDAQYDHSVEKQKEALNQQTEDYEAFRSEEITDLQESLSDREFVISRSLELVRENSARIGEAITEKAAAQGLRLSLAITKPWFQGKDAVAAYGTTVSAESSAFVGNLMEIESEIWSLQAKANETAYSLSGMFSEKAEGLVAELTDSYTSAENLNTMVSVLHNSLISTLEGGYEVNEIINSVAQVTESLNKAASASSALKDSLSQNASKWYVVDKNGIPLTKGYQTSGEASSKIGFTGGGVGIKQYASGTRNAVSQLRIVDEHGYELTLPKLSSGRYAIGNQGDQILTRQETDNLFDWAQLTPDILSHFSTIPTVRDLSLNPKSSFSPVEIKYDSLIRVDGDVNNSNIRQIQEVVQDGLRQFAAEVNRDWRYGKK